MARCCKIGVGIPLDFDQIANLTDSENVVLELGPSGTSLPTRDYYTGDNFAEQRGWYKEHLQKIAQMFDLPEEWAERVMRFETKLAQIQMKQDQSRQFDQ